VFVHVIRPEINAKPWSRLTAMWTSKRKPAPYLAALPLHILASYARALAATQQFPVALAKMKEVASSDPQNAEWHDELGSLCAASGLGRRKAGVYRCPRVESEFGDGPSAAKMLAQS
jgi:hypothetical protein